MVLRREDIKQQVVAVIEDRKQELIDLSLRIHANPEIAFEEEKAATWLSEYLEAEGFSLERGICDLPTAFRATYGEGEPRLAFISEYDALPGLGHGCGHNIIACIGVGAAIAAKSVQDELGGTIHLIGTPAEEAEGGKVFMVKRGAFEGLDAAMMVHPGNKDIAVASALACVEIQVEYFGKEAHAAARPEDGVNALDAMVIAYNALSALRQQVRDSARFHGIITDGGQAVNVIPAHTAARFLVRAEDDQYLEALKEKVLACFQAGAAATGAKLEHTWDEAQYATVKNNMSLVEAYSHNLEALGRRVEEPEGRAAMGSTDMGNVSHVVPSIHPHIAIAPPHVPIHTAEFREIAASEAGHRGLLDAAKALAMTAVDFYMDEDLQKRAWEEFRSSI
jgi:amidohydrolase